MLQTILVVDDQPNIRMMLREYLTEQGYRVETATDGRHALFVARESHPDLVLLDEMMPNLSGFEFLRSFRKESDAPVIMLTARLEEADKVTGLELGADDYLTKPFGLRELLARIKAVMRRSRPVLEAAGTRLSVGDAALDLVRYQVFIAQKAIELTPTEFELVKTMMNHPGRAFSRLELLERVQGEDGESIERTIDVHIRNLRTKLEPDPKKPRYIETVFGIGYRFADLD